MEAPKALARVLSFFCAVASSLKPDINSGFETQSGIATPFSSPEGGIVLLDLRTREDFQAWRFPLSINLPLEALSSDTCSPFGDSSTLEKQWLELEALFEHGLARTPLNDEKSLVGHQVLVICYDGDTSRVATSILRAKNIEACSMRGGIRGMLFRWPELQKTHSTV